MASCYLGDHIARDYTHYSKKNLRNYNRSTALERSVIENGGGGGGGGGTSVFVLMKVS